MPNKLFYQLQMRPPKLEEYFGFYRCQLNFAIYAATSALGISKQHLTQKSGLLGSVYRFHVYYHIRRILSLLGSPIPHEDGYKNGTTHLMLMLTTRYALNTVLILTMFGCLESGCIQHKGIYSRW